MTHVLTHPDPSAARRSEADEGPRDLAAFHSIRRRVEVRLAALVAGSHGLAEVIRYAVLAPGKRIRPLLVMLTAEDCGARDERALDLACALEMIHAASLILDDLPCMDDALWRRDRPATHVRFGEDAAVLAAVSLLSRAQEVVATGSALDPAIRCRAAAILARAVGAAGLSGGQYMDLRTAGQTDAARLAGVNDLKTGSLFVAAVKLGCVAAEAKDEHTRLMMRFAAHLGQAFQILDDLADAGEIAAGRSDADAARKATLPDILGRSRSLASLLDHVAACDAILDPAGKLRRFVGHVFEGAGLSAARREERAGAVP